MSNLTDSLLSQYIPKLALMVYESKSLNRSEKYYLESHDINEHGQIMAGKPLLQETIQSIVDVFFDERKSRSEVTGLIPENVLYFNVLPGGNYKMLWFRTSEQRVVHHSPQLKIKTDNAFVPALIYMVQGYDLYVFALKSNQRPNEKVVIYKAPFFNVDDTGLVCLGSAKVKKPTSPTYETLMKYWEDLFWLSEFSHVNGSEKVKSKDLAKVWRSILGTKKKFPISELLPSKKTISALTLKNSI